MMQLMHIATDTLQSSVDQKELQEMRHIAGDAKIPFAQVVSVLQSAAIHAPMDRVGEAQRLAPAGTL